MTDKYVFEKTVGEDGALQLPPDAPRGRLRFTLEPVQPELSSEEEDELDAKIAELLTDENLRGQGQTAAEIARAPEIGIWKDRTDITDSVEYVEDMRRENMRKRLSHD